MKNISLISFADLSVEKRKIKSEFFKQINHILTWSEIEIEIEKHYKKGLSADGRPSYPGLTLFKILLLQNWYGLSDYEVEDSVNDRISFSQFVGLSLEDKSPDHSVISRFRNALTQKNAFEKLLQLVNKQLESHCIIVIKGAIIDASITDSPRKPRGKKEYELIENSNTDEQLEKMNKAVEKVQTHVDTDAKWVKKAGRLRFGYKKNCITDEHGLILGVHTTSANVNEVSNLEEVLSKCALKKGTRLKGDKGYKSEKNDMILKEKGLINHIMLKDTRGTKLRESQKRFNKLISKIRYKIERTFGSIKRWFKTGEAKYVGLERTHTQHILEAIAYNLYRSPKIEIV